MKELKNQTLYFGDNLEILRDKIPDECIDLIYLDPPFNSNQNYNILYKEGLIDSPAQIQAFEDSWHWTEEAQHIFEELIGVKESKTKINQDISDLMLAFEKMVGKNDVLAYLTMMTIRLIELKRVLKPTGSIYLHCDPTASHYLKIVMDAIFGKLSFRNEIIWKRTNSPKAQTKQFGSQHDIILFYSKSGNFTFNKTYSQLEKSNLKPYSYNDENGQFRLIEITAAGVQNYTGRKQFDFQGIKAPYLYKKERLQEMWDKGLLYKTSSGSIKKKQYLKDMPGLIVSDIWVDQEVKPLQGSSAESLNYSTQKPETLLERIIKASSNKSDWVLDPFCGCGTTVAAAEKLNRNWIGIDITSLAITLIKSRLEKKFPEKKLDIEIDGLPKDLSGAKKLAEKDRFEFEYWALHFINAIPAQNKTKENMRGADKGVDGTITFYKKLHSTEEIGKAIVQVKSGGVKRNDIATLKGDIEREKADAGILITLEEPTRPMIEEVVAFGSYCVDFSKEEFPKIQILTIQDLLNGKKPKLPYSWHNSVNKEAKAEEINNQENLFEK